MMFIDFGDIMESSLQKEDCIVKSAEALSHVAIIMDGNRRYAKNKGMSTFEGHKAGADNLIRITEAASNINLKVLTVYAFSTENWMRSVTEVQNLLEVLEVYLIKMRPMLIEKGIRLSTIGDLRPFPKHLQELFNAVCMETNHGKGLELVLAVNYGGRADLAQAMKKIVGLAMQKKIDSADISEDLIGKQLYTSRWPDPDLLIRTSGEQRVSNFLLWQISYTEIYLENTLWPEFTKEQFYDAIKSYKKRIKRLGQ